MNFEQKLDPVITRYEELTALLAQEQNGDEFVKLSKELSSLEEVTQVGRRYKKVIADLSEAEGMMNDVSLDPEMKEMASEEYYTLKSEVSQLEREIQILLLPKDEADDRNVILEIRAGTGGEEAALFGGELFRMYERYAALKGWRFEVLSLSETGLGGYKEAVAQITGNSVFARLKFESGAHRVQRVPETESGGRVHNSAATVAVLP